MELSLPVYITIAFILIILSGVFNLFDSSLDLCRKSRLEKEKSRRYKAVLKIIEKPENISLACRLWSNIFISLAAVFAYLILMTLSAIIDSEKNYLILFIALFAIIFGSFITLLSFALPKMLSKTKPEKIAAILCPFMKFFSMFLFPAAIPFVKLAAAFKNTLKTEIDDLITEDELRDALIEGEKSGIVESNERTMVEGVFYLGDRPVGAFMTHRSEIEWLDINNTDEENRAKAIERRKQQCFPVVNGSPDEIIGAVYLEDIIINLSQSEPKELRAIMKKAQFVPETMSAIKAFESFKQGQSNFLFVMDEYGGLAGIISVRALVEEIVGELSAPAANESPLQKQEDGTWLADGSLNIDDAVKALGITGFEEEGEFHTLAGLILHLSGELPKVGDTLEHQGYKFKVIDKDGNRIDKLLITKIEGSS